MLLPLLLLALPLGQFDVVASKEFSADVQSRALLSTVRILNLTTKFRGSGALLKSDGGFVYILTADHVVEKGEGFEIATFSSESYPRTEALYRAAEIVARSAEADLALLRMS